MAGSITYSSKGGSLVSATPTNLEIPQTAQTIAASQRIAVIGTVDGKAPMEQTIAITSASAVTLAAPALSSQAPIKDGQRATVVNVGPFPIVIPLNGFNTGSQPETLEPRQMIQVIFKTPIGWIPCDDDGDQMPVMWANQGLKADPASQRMYASDKGLRLRNGTLTDPITRLQTTSFGAKQRKVGAGTSIGYEDFTVILDDTQPGVFSLPDPKTCPDRLLNLVAIKSVIQLSIAGGTKARSGNADYLQIPAGSAAMLQSVGDATFAQWYRVGGF
jgi:hypothetical protein